MSQGQGTILKKCTCGNQQRCPHKWTLRYWVDGRQRERSFADELGTDGRPRYGSGKRLARDWQIKIANDKREQAFVDPRLGSVKFGAAAAQWITRLPDTENTKDLYRSVLNAHVGVMLGERTLASVAQSRDDVIDLLTVRMGHLSKSRRGLARSLVTGVLDEAVAAGKITSHRCGGIPLADNGNPSRGDDFVFPAHAQLTALAGGINDGLTVWLMRGCGLRIQEALAVQKSCFRENGTVLRVFEQASRDGRKMLPLKHRKAGEYRDIPLPAYVWAMVRGLPDGYLFMRNGKVPGYSWYLDLFTREARKAGIADGFTPHSLRHAFASALLARGVPISDVTKWLGHRDINITYGTYGHLVPSAFGRAQDVLNAEYTQWSSEGDELPMAA